MRFPETIRRPTGIVVPVAALRSASSAGVGEFPDLAELGAFCAKTGIELVQLLPVNDSGFQSSPYSALSAFALHPLYLRIGDLPEAAPFAADAAGIRERFESAVRFPFAEVLRTKLELLGRIYRAAAAGIAEEAESGPLADWIDRNGWVREYAVYRRLKDARSGTHWKEWGTLAAAKEADIRALWEDRALRGEHLFWVWLQKKLDEQFSAAAAALAERGVVLKGDLPILMNEDSCDVWAHPEYFRRDLAAGAPPDMYSPLGQNWDFPIYDWDALAKDDYRWWRDRLRTADRYYAAYRIDHVLGFFRIWATSRADRAALLGRFVPALPLERRELEALGFDAGRIRWLSRPHLSGAPLRAAAREAGLSEAATGKVFESALERIGTEDLWLFADRIGGEVDLEGLGLPVALTGFLKERWRDRALLEYEADRFQPLWTFRNAGAYPTLSDEERRRLEELIARKRDESERIWEAQGERLLAELKATTPMLACAEDLGAVPDCVPRVLGKLGILGLRVIRWARRWNEAGQPYVPLGEYPPLSVCAPAVHDSSTVREWWEREAERGALIPLLGAEAAAEERYSPRTAAAVLGAAARSASDICVFQLQDLLHLNARYYAEDPASERVNIPGTVGDFNWTYRMPVPVSALAEDAELAASVRSIVEARKERT